MTTIDERLYKLLPTTYRMRDAEQGEPLRALLAVMEGQFAQIRNDIGRLYDNWFIETCDEWVVPYIGDLLGVRGQYVFDNASMSMRPFVANTLRYRRQKGTASMLEGLAADVTGWPARGVEFFRLLATTQHLNHIRLEDVRTPDLRDTDALELLGGPFERAMHFADVRHISSHPGKYNIGNVGIFLWRLEAFPIDRVPATPGVGAGRYRFDQLGVDRPLFNTKTAELAGRVIEADMPGPLRPRAVYDELHAARASLSAGETPLYRYLEERDGRTPAFQIFSNGQPIAPEKIQICDLSNWGTLPTAESVSLPLPQGGTLEAIVSVDPALGRFVFLDGGSPQLVQVSYAHGFSAEIGGGAYVRRPGVEPPATATIYHVALIDPAQSPDDAFMDALEKWKSDEHPDAVFVFEGPAMFRDAKGNPHGSGIFQTDDIVIPPGCNVMLRAADLSRPILRAMTRWRVTLAEDSTFTMNGLLVMGEGMQIETTSTKSSILHTVTIEDTTFVPGFTLDAKGDPASKDTVSLSTESTASGNLDLHITRSIIGRIAVSSGAADFIVNLRVCDSIVDGTKGTARAITTHGALKIERSTVLGTVAAMTLEASEVIFDEPVVATRTQVGCVRYSYFPAMSTTPSAYRCQPALALEAAGTDAAAIERIHESLEPSYTSRRYGDAGYAQLAVTCPVEIATGAEAGREMGAFHLLMQPQRLANLQLSLDEYLRFGLEAGAFLVT